jgi:DNA-binding CsgD family transcriptional regulator
VQRIHEAPLIPDGWARALPSIAAAIRGEHTFFLVQNAQNWTAEFVAGFEVPPEQLSDFAAAASARTLHWREALLTVAPGVAMQSSAMYSDRDFAHSTFYNEAIRPIGDFYGMLVSPLRMRQWHAYLAVGRLLGREDYDAEDLAVMHVLAPHLATALRVSHRLVTADLRTASADAALDRLDTAVIFTDATARILFANRIAETLLAANDGIGFDKGSLCARDRSANLALRRAVAGCAGLTPVNGGPGGMIEIPRGDGRLPLRVVVAPFRSHAELDTALLRFARPVAILMIANPEDEQRARKDDLRRRFRLTPAEADVTLEILKGDGREAAAARLGISMTTVRTHLSHIFEKTGVRRQAELVRLLMCSDRS